MFLTDKDEMILAIFAEVLTNTMSANFEAIKWHCTFCGDDQNMKYEQQMIDPK